MAGGNGRSGQAGDEAANIELNFIRLGVRWVYNHDDHQFACGTTAGSWNWPLPITDRKNGLGSVPTISLTQNFSPTWVNEFVAGVGRGGVSIAPQGDAATRTSSGINTPLLYPSANAANRPHPRCSIFLGIPHGSLLALRFVSLA